MKYHKINAPFKRDMSVKPSPLIMGDWAMPEFRILQDIIWDGYEKVDGTNIRVYFYHDENGIKSITFKGRTDNSDIPKHLLTYLKEFFTIERFAMAFDVMEMGTHICIHGEGYGNKIQKMGKLYMQGKEEVSFICFDVMIDGLYLTKKNVDNVCSKMGIDMVPIRAQGTLDELFRMVANGMKSDWGDFYAEGLVATPQGDFLTRRSERIITKIKHKDFYER